MSDIIKAHAIYTDYGADKEGNIYTRKRGTWKKMNPSENSKGYYQFYVYVDGKGLMKKVHRIVYECFHGSLENTQLIDHINRKKYDNRLKNLRVVTNSENLRNQGLSKRNRSGYKGISWHRRDKKWQCFICDNNKNIYLGGYDNIKDAVEARKLAEIKLGYLPQELDDEN